jgi:hypothetical protein
MRAAAVRVLPVAIFNSSLHRCCLISFGLLGGIGRIDRLTLGFDHRQRMPVPVGLT